jgi:hypothetical protein
MIKRLPAEKRNSRRSFAVILTLLVSAVLFLAVTAGADPSAEIDLGGTSDAEFGLSVSVDPAQDIALSPALEYLDEIQGRGVIVTSRAASHPDGIVLSGETVVFEIVVANRHGDALIQSGLSYKFDTELLEFESAEPPAQDLSEDGLLVWEDLIGSFGEVLNPGEQRTLEITFIANPEIVTEKQGINRVRTLDPVDLSGELLSRDFGRIAYAVAAPCVDDEDCDDGLYCNGDEFCNPSNVCANGTPPDCSNDGLWCNGTEFCDDVNDQCGHENVPDCSDDGLYCNGEEYCNESTDQCATQAFPDCIDDGEWCNGEENGNCDEINDECEHINIPDCGDDGIFCNGEEYCNELVDECKIANVPECLNDGEWCNGEETGKCDEINDECEHLNVPPCEEDGLFCNGEQFCDEDLDQCDSRDIPECLDDGEWCNGEETGRCDDVNDECERLNEPCPDNRVWCDGVESCDEEKLECWVADIPCSESQICEEDTQVCQQRGLGDVEDPDASTNPDKDGDEELWPEGDVSGGCCSG